LQIGQTPSCRNGFPEGAIPCRRLSLLVLRIPDLEPTTDHSNRVAVVGPPLGPSDGFGRRKTGPDGNAGSGGAMRSCFARSSGRALPGLGARHRTASRGRKATGSAARGEPRRTSARRPSTGTLAVVRGADRETEPRSPGHVATRAVSPSGDAKSTASVVAPRKTRVSCLPRRSARTDAVREPRVLRLRQSARTPEWDGLQQGIHFE
jgi:hypothetical protein